MNAGKTIFIILILTLSGISSGCLGSIEPEVNDNKVRILTYDVYALSEVMVAQFEQDTGYEVEFIKVGDGGAVLETALRNRQTPIADLIIGIDNSFLQVALDHELYRALDLETPALHPQASAPYSGVYAVPYDWGRVCLNIDSAYADGEDVSIPTSLWEFTGDEWKGKVAIQNPRTSTPGRAFLAATVFYFENDADDSTDYADWWQSMSDNGAIISNGWSDSYLRYYEAGYGIWEDGFIGGAHAVVSYCHSPGAEAYWGGGQTASVALNISAASFLQVEYAGIASGPGVNVEGAEAFLNFLLSEELQATIPDTNVMYPALASHSLPSGAYSDHTAVPATDATISMVRIGSEMNEWLDEWDEAMA